MKWQPRYDEDRGVFRECKWCHGRGCLYCPAEAKKAYKRQFPDGPKPILTIPLEKSINLGTKAGEKRLIKVIAEVLGKKTGGTANE
jgi:hypothetical protein